MILASFFGAMGAQCSDKPSGFGELFGVVETTIQLMCFFSFLREGVIAKKESLHCGSLDPQAGLHMLNEPLLELLQGQSCCRADHRPSPHSAVVEAGWS